MAGRYEKAITILDAIRKIDDRSYLLPAIQRNFVWSPQQICTLFDSLMRKYPINSFMLWDVTSPDIKNKFRFYSFLTDYCERFKESNDYVPTQGDFKDFKAVIDGQQRLTSIYIGLKGTYATKKSRIWWPSTRNDEALPPRKFYLDLAKGLDSDENETLAEYRFQFLTKEQVAQQQGGESHWFEVGEVLRLPTVNSVDEIHYEAVLPYLEKHGLTSNEFARKTLNRLYYLVRHEEVIYSYNETSQDIDHVLDVFIRTNSGGTPLAFSDLLMSIAIANWKGDARKDIDDLVTEVRQSAEMQFSINRDWILKTCLMLTGADVKFRVKNFDSTQVERIQNQWPQIRACVVETFKLLQGFGLSDQSLRAKNAVIPIAHYLFTKKFDGGVPLYTQINNLKHLREERLSLSRWLHMALLRGIFGGQADTVLSKMRRVLNDHHLESRFPLEAIIEAFRGTNKDLRFDEDYLAALLDVQYGDPRCRSVLSLLYPEINENFRLDIDHLHPQSGFTKPHLANESFLIGAPELLAFYENPANWNSLVNLHLLNASQNRSKQGQTLSQWMADKANGFSPADILLGADDSLEFTNFKTFCEKRRLALLNRLRQRVAMSGTAQAKIEVFDDDREIEMAS